MSDLPSHRLHGIQFFYDPISPYAYLAFERLPEMLMGHSVCVRYRPVLFAALLKAYGQLGPAEVPGKRDWTYRQVSWLAQEHGIPLALPASHPFNPLALLRLGLACARDEAPGDTNRFVTEQLFRHVWQGGGDAGDPVRMGALEARLQEHMRSRSLPWLGGDGPDAKQRLRANTEEALALGIFGVPSMVVDGRIFWGQDALPMLRAYLENHAWYQTGDWDAAQALPAGVKRPL